METPTWAYFNILNEVLIIITCAIYSTIAEMWTQITWETLGYSPAQNKMNTIFSSVLCVCRPSVTHSLVAVNYTLYLCTGQALKITIKPHIFQEALQHTRKQSIPKQAQNVSVFNAMFQFEVQHASSKVSCNEIPLIAIYFGVRYCLIYPRFSQPPRPPKASKFFLLRDYSGVGLRSSKFTRRGRGPSGLLGAPFSIYKDTISFLQK